MLMIKLFKNILIINAALFLFAATIYYFILFESFPIFLIIFDTASHLFKVSPFVLFVYYLTYKLESRVLIFTFTACAIMFISLFLSYVNLNSAKDVALSQKIMGSWAYIDGYATSFGLMIVALNNLFLSTLAMFPLWRKMMSNSAQVEKLQEK